MSQPEIALDNVVWVSDAYMLRGHTGPCCVVVHTHCVMGRVATVCRKAVNMYVPVMPQGFTYRTIDGTNAAMKVDVALPMLRLHEAEIRAHTEAVYAEEIGYETFSPIALVAREVVQWSVLLHYADGSDVLHTYQEGACVRAREVAGHERAILAMRARAWRAETEDDNGQA